MNERSKDVTLDGVDYKIDLIPADIGSLIVTQLRSGMHRDEGVYLRIQAYCLDAVMRYKVTATGEKIPVKIFDRRQDKWLAPDLQYDLLTVNDIYEQVMEFNFRPFLERLTARAEAAKRLATSQQDSPTI